MGTEVSSGGSPRGTRLFLGSQAPIPASPPPRGAGALRNMPKVAPFLEGSSKAGHCQPLGLRCGGLQC